MGQQIPPLTMMRRGTSLLPASGYSEDRFCEDVRTTKPVLVQITQPRNPKHSDLFWVVATRVAENSEKWASPTDAVEWVKVKLGMVKTYVDWGDRVLIQTESISPAVMDQIRFSRFFDRALWLWSTELGIDVTTLRKASDPMFGHDAPQQSEAS